MVSKARVKTRKKTAKNKKKSIKLKKQKKPKIKKTPKKQEKISKPQPRSLTPQAINEIKELLTNARTRRWLVEVGGENSLSIIKNLLVLTNDEELAKLIKVRISDVRACLNKLHNEGIVSYIRDKNTETNWYTYTWFINEEKIKKWVQKREEKERGTFFQEGVQFYFCKSCGVESAVHFEVAIENSFRCQNCNSILDFLDEKKFEKLQKNKEEGY